VAPWPAHSPLQESNTNPLAPVLAVNVTDGDSGKQIGPFGVLLHLMVFA
jgi:hypothetical protein